VALPSSEAFTDYKVRLEIETVTGTPLPGAFTPYVTNKTNVGFDINVPAAPGVGNSITYRYSTWR
jgi:hypothetical protein